MSSISSTDPKKWTLQRIIEYYEPQLSQDPIENFKIATVYELSIAKVYEAVETSMAEVTGQLNSSLTNKPAGFVTVVKETEDEGCLLSTYPLIEEEEKFQGVLNSVTDAVRKIQVCSDQLTKLAFHAKRVRRLIKDLGKNRKEMLKTIRSTKICANNPMIRVSVKKEDLYSLDKDLPFEQRPPYAPD